MASLVKVIISLGAVGFLFQTLAGTIITANLPAKTAVINISSTQDYAASYDSGKVHWYSPSSTLGSASLLEYTFSPGTYAFRIVDPADAARLYPTLTSPQTNQVCDAIANFYGKR